MLLFYLFLLILGLAVGSFLGVLTFRLPKKISLSGRSFCTSCRQKIAWYENIPIFSYLWLRARCSLCGKRIPLRYPLLESLAAASFVLTGYLAINTGPEHGLAFVLRQQLGVFFLPFLLLVVSALLTLLVTDSESGVLPDEVLLPLAVTVLLTLLALPSPTIFGHLFWGLGVFIFFLALYLLTGGRGMGFGDVKLSFVMGSLLGWPEALVWLFLAFLAGAASGLVLILLGRARFGRPIPFGPYLLVSAYAALFWGERIWEIGIIRGIWGIGG